MTNNDKIKAQDAIVTEVAKAIDQQVCDAIRSNARITQFIGKEDFINNLKRAVEFLNRPDYYLIANPGNQEALENWVHNDKDLKIKVLYASCVPETELLLVKDGAITMKPFKVEYSDNFHNNFQNATLKLQAPKVNPEEVRVLRVK